MKIYRKRASLWIIIFYPYARESKFINIYNSADISRTVKFDVSMAVVWMPFAIEIKKMS